MLRVQFLLAEQVAEQEARQITLARIGEDHDDGLALHFRGFRQSHRHGHRCTGACNNLIERAADVTLKERRQLILVPREAPYSSIHLEHMLKLSNMGVTILPASPGFYHQPQTIDDLIDFVVARILNLLNIPQDMLPRWGEHHLTSDE